MTHYPEIHIHHYIYLDKRKHYVIKEIRYSILQMVYTNHLLFFAEIA